LTILNVLEAIKKRRSVRAYTEKMVSEKDIEQLIEAASCAPSAGNVQPWAFVVIKDPETKHKLSDAALHQTFIQKAPVVIIVFTDVKRSIRVYGKRGENLYSIQDAAAASENLLLAAQHMGLATCWIGAFRENEVAEALNAPMHLRPVTIIPVGYPAEKPVVPRKRLVNDIIHYGTY
jgi:nitroreductase